MGKCYSTITVYWCLLKQYFTATSIGNMMMKHSIFRVPQCQTLRPNHDASPNWTNATKHNLYHYLYHDLYHQTKHNHTIWGQSWWFPLLNMICMLTSLWDWSDPALITASQLYLDSLQPEFSHDCSCGLRGLQIACCSSAGLKQSCSWKTPRTYTHPGRCKEKKLGFHSFEAGRTSRHGPKYKCIPQ